MPIARRLLWRHVCESESAREVINYEIRDNVFSFFLRFYVFNVLYIFSGTFFSFYIYDIEETVSGCYF